MFWVYHLQEGKHGLWIDQGENDYDYVPDDNERDLQLFGFAACYLVDSFNETWIRHSFLATPVYLNIW